MRFFIAVLSVFFLSITSVSAMPTGRTAWTCETDPAIYPGWWAFKNLGYVGSPATIDGARAMAPSAHKVGDEVWLYYLAERLTGGTSSYTVLRVTAPFNDPANFTPKNIALQFPAGHPVYPGPTDPAEGYYAMGPYHAAVMPRLDAQGLPAKDGSGNFLPWYMYFATVGNNPGVARSTDGGVTFSLLVNKSPLFPFEVYQIRSPSGVMEWRRVPVKDKSKGYDYGGTGSSSGIRAPDGTVHLFSTTMAAGKQTYADLGVTALDVGHPNGQIADIGIGYASSSDGETFTRQTAQGLGVTSTAKGVTGRIVEPRRWDEPNGLYEYIVSRPMVFEDGVMPGTSTPRYRLMVSTHSKTYRARSLHSDDLINWTWDASPATGTFGLGASGGFDDEHAAYPSCFRDDDDYHCYYTGNGYGHYTNAPTGIGYCTAEALN